MLLLNPRIVKFGSQTWDNVRLVSIDRSAHRTVEEWSDDGPYSTLADVPEQRVAAKIVMDVTRDDVTTPRPGESGTLVFYTSPAASDGGRRKVSATAVVTAVSHELSLKNGAVRTVTFALVSSAGSADPVTIADAGGEA